MTTEERIAALEERYSAIERKQRQMGGFILWLCAISFCAVGILFIRDSALANRVEGHWETQLSILSCLSNEKTLDGVPGCVYDKVVNKHGD